MRPPGAASRERWINSEPLNALALAGRPVLLDAESRYWNTFANRYWPAFHLDDGDRRHVVSRIGEMHQGRESADSLEAAIAGLLAR